MKVNKLNNFKKRINKLLNKPKRILVLVFFLALFLGLIVFYYYIFLPTLVDFSGAKKLVDVDENSYEKIIKEWNLQEAKLQSIDNENHYDIFSPKREDIVISIDNFLNESLTSEELDFLLEETLFEFYISYQGDMPPISERGWFWENLNLGTREEYRGSYSQNILLLETLKRELNNYNF